MHPEIDNRAYLRWSSKCRQTPAIGCSSIADWLVDIIGLKTSDLRRCKGTSTVVTPKVILPMVKVHGFDKMVTRYNASKHQQLNRWPTWDAHLPRLKALRSYKSALRVYIPVAHEIPHSWYKSYRHIRLRSGSSLQRCCNILHEDFLQWELHISIFNKSVIRVNEGAKLKNH